MCSVCVILLLFAQRAAAASLTVAWDPDPGAAGFTVSYGTQSGVYTNSVNASLQTSQQITGLADGTMYYFIVRAYDATGAMSPPSLEVSGMTSGTASSSPVIQCPTPIGSSTNGSPVVVTFSPTVSGGTAPVNATCSPASGSLFPVGSTPTTCTATDSLQLSASCSTSVVVTYNPPAPTAPPSIMCPVPSATSYDGKPVAVTFTATVSGGTAPVSSTCTPASGSLFPVGTTALNCSANDAKGLTASCTSSVIVTASITSPTPTVPAPTSTPTIACPLMAPVASHSGNAMKVYFSPTVTGGVAPITTSCTPLSGSLFQIGTTPVTCLATDAQRQVDSCATSVIVYSSNPNSPSPPPSGNTATEFEGVVNSLTGKCPTATFKVGTVTVGTVSVTTDSFTNYAKGACGSLSNGRNVHVQGLVQPDASVVATAITYIK
jgi:Domain of unknown function (DUF5666)/Fibronectin type III domain/HYR domain